MIIGIPDTLTTDSSGKYKVSIRFMPDGFSFSGHIPHVPGSFFYKEIFFDKSASYIDSLKEYFFANDFFTWSYKEITILFEESQYVLIPKPLTDAKKEKEFLNFHHLSPENKVLSLPIDSIDASLVYGVNNEVYEFCSRSFIHPKFIHRIFPLFTFVKRGIPVSLYRQMSVVLHQKMMDIFLFDKGELSFLNTFHIDKIQDIIYYILYIWKQTEMDQLKDELYIAGTIKWCNETMAILPQYLQRIEHIETPSDIYLLGDEIAKTPISLIANLMI